MNNIAFILGSPRSGTTWVWGLLESNPDTIPFVVQNANGNLKNMSGDSYSTSESGIYVRNPNGAKLILQNFMRHHSDKLVIEKTPSHITKAEKIFQDFPTSKVILVNRHPLSIVNSMLHTNMKLFKKYDINKSIDKAKKHLSKYKTVRELSKDYLEIRYEEVLDDTLGYAKQMCSFLNIEDYSEKMVNENSRSSKVKVSGMLRKATKFSYLNDMTQAQINTASSALKKEIEEYETGWNN